MSAGPMGRGGGLSFLRSSADQRRAVAMSPTSHEAVRAARSARLVEARMNNVLRNYT
jgi:hypothetical protein